MKFYGKLMNVLQRVQLMMKKKDLINKFIDL
jgi:hypothetical protein